MKVQEFVANTLDEIKAGVASANAVGIRCEMPEEVGFTLKLDRDGKIGGEAEALARNVGEGIQTVTFTIRPVT